MLVWSKILGRTFASSVLLALNPAGYGGSMYRRVQALQMEAKKLSPHYKKYAESDLRGYFMSGAFAERQLLKKLRSGEAF